MTIAGSRHYWWKKLRTSLGEGRPGTWRWLLMYLCGRVIWFRRLARGRGRPSSHSVDGESVLEADVPGIVETVRSVGFDTRLRLPASVVHDLAARTRDTAASAPYSTDEPPIEGSVERLGLDPTFSEIAAGYLGCAPVYQGCRFWWLDPDSGEDPLSSGTRFHYDLYDYGALVFLCYLTDVADGGGAHVCVSGSHRDRSWRDQLHPRRHRSDDDILRTYGKDRIVEIRGPAGTVIAEDPFCFHKATVPVTGPRLAVQFLYTAGDFAAPSFRRRTAAPTLREISITR